MLRFTFRGGINTDDRKAMSKDKPIREVLHKGENDGTITGNL